MTYSSKHEMTLFEIQARDIHTPSPTPPLIGPHYVQLKHHIINIDWMIIY